MTETPNVVYYPHECAEDGCEHVVTHYWADPGQEITVRPVKCAEHGGPEFVDESDDPLLDAFEASHK